MSTDMNKNEVLDPNFHTHNRPVLSGFATFPATLTARDRRSTTLNVTPTSGMALSLLSKPR